jgi:hypothetical protein
MLEDMVFTFREVVLACLVSGLAGVCWGVAARRVGIFGSRPGQCREGVSKQTQIGVNR